MSIAIHFLCEISMCGAVDNNFSFYAFSDPCRISGLTKEFDQFIRHSPSGISILWTDTEMCSIDILVAGETVDVKSSASLLIFLFFDL